MCFSRKGFRWPAGRKHQKDGWRLRPSRYSFYLKLVMLTKHHLIETLRPL